MSSSLDVCRIGWVPLALLGAWHLVACSSSKQPEVDAGADAGVHLLDDAPVLPLDTDAAADPIGAVVARLPGHLGAWAQV
jgi:hypothetical protein